MVQVVMVRPANRNSGTSGWLVVGAESSSEAFIFLSYLQRGGRSLQHTAENVKYGNLEATDAVSGFDLRNLDDAEMARFCCLGQGGEVYVRCCDQTRCGGWT